MADAKDLGDLRFLLADLAAKADAGDEAAELRLNDLAPQCSAEVCRAAADLAGALGLPSITTPAEVLPGAGLFDALQASLYPDPWPFIEAAIGRIASHYRIDLTDVWNVYWDLDIENLERVFETPEGVSLLGHRIATALLGWEEAEATAPLHFSFH